MTLILDGKIARDSIVETLKNQVAAFSRKPCLAIIQIGSLPESGAYIRQKKLLGEKIGCIVSHVELPLSVSEKELIATIQKLNADSATDGIIVQMPFPTELDRQSVVNAILPAKDVDGLHPLSKFTPATTKGILSLLDFYKIPIAGKKVVVLGRSALVGMPTAKAFIDRNATVTVCHSHTENLSQETKSAVILVAAIGKPKFITRDFVSAGAVVVDVGINVVDGKKLEDEIPERKLVGDVDFENVKDIVSAISPVPGGVGPMTVVSLFQNLVEAYNGKK